MECFLDDISYMSALTPHLLNLLAIYFRECGVSSSKQLISLDPKQ